MALKGEEGVFCREVRLPPPLGDRSKFENAGEVGERCVLWVGVSDRGAYAAAEREESLLPHRGCACVADWQNLSRRLADGP